MPSGKKTDQIASAIAAASVVSARAVAACSSLKVRVGSSWQRCSSSAAICWALWR
ncbi:MAG: hypothetical protein HC873_02190 [Leptolyngbyaceae cyanobacterium SL_1_1]|nr:hypothetical protein [Leptolyngbyaceae cyanobacterium SL_1_1]